MRPAMSWGRPAATSAGNESSGTVSTAAIPSVFTFLSYCRLKCFAPPTFRVANIICAQPRRVYIVQMSIVYWLHVYSMLFSDTQQSSVSANNLLLVWSGLLTEGWCTATMLQEGLWKTMGHC